MFFVLTQLESFAPDFKEFEYKILMNHEAESESLGFNKVKYI